jgi:F-type H+-transporting ATPase subunit epsilon
VSDDVLHVELVAADRRVWSGEAQMVIARTTEGDIGVLANHEPTLSLMVDGVVEVWAPDGEVLVAAVDEGFFSVAYNRVSILSQHVELSHEIDLEKARQVLENAERSGEPLQDEEAAVRRAEARVRAVERAR